MELILVILIDGEHGGFLDGNGFCIISVLGMGGCKNLEIDGYLPSAQIASSAG